MKIFYRMSIGRIEFAAFLILGIIPIIIASIYAWPWNTYELRVLALYISGIIAFDVLFTYTRYKNKRDGKNILRMKMYLDNEGIKCKDNDDLIWSCRWNEIHHCEKRYSFQSHRCVYIYLYKDDKAPFYFECSLSANKAFRDICPRKELLSQARRLTPFPAPRDY